MKIKKRLDVLLVERLYAETRSKAQAIIMTGNVYVNGQKADKPGTSFEETVVIQILPGMAMKIWWLATEKVMMLPSLPMAHYWTML